MSNRKWHNFFDVEKNSFTNEMKLKERNEVRKEKESKQEKTSNDIVAGNGMVLYFKWLYIVVVNYQDKIICTTKLGSP